MVGGDGNDTLEGGLGNDLLTGGTGDSFRFGTALGAGNVDRIVDFSHVDDTFRLSHAVFSALAAGVLPSGAFVDLATGAETAASRILYNSTGGAVQYDADGLGGVSAIQFAVLSTHPVLNSSDFFVF